MRMQQFVGAVLAVIIGGLAQAQPAGVATVAELDGEVTSMQEGAVRGLKVGDQLFVGDQVSTSKRGKVVFRYEDGSVITLGPKTTMQQQTYVLKARDEAFVVRMVSGTFKMLTGLLAKRSPEQVIVQTRVATIGIRGTHFGGAVEGDRAAIVLLELPEGQSNAIEVSNEFGSVRIDEAGFGTEVPDANSPPSAPRRMRLAVVEQLSRRAFRPPGMR